MTSLFADRFQGIQGERTVETNVITVENMKRVDLYPAFLVLLDKFERTAANPFVPLSMTKHF